jgi:hypothetical protein
VEKFWSCAVANLSISPEEVDEIRETVRREQPDIERAAINMQKCLRGLSDVSQKQAIATLASGWIKARCPDDKEKALLLSEYLREQVDLFLHAIMKDEQRH